MPEDLLEPEMKWGAGPTSWLILLGRDGRTPRVFRSKTDLFFAKQEAERKFGPCRSLPVEGTDQTYIVRQAPAA